MKRHPETIAFWIGRLPHWEVVDGRYFVTLSLRGAVPPAGRRQIRARIDELTNCARDVDWIRRQRRLFLAIERWLDRQPTVTHLRIPAVAEMVCEAIEHRDRRGGWDVFEFVVMPSHVHLFVEMTGSLHADGSRLKHEMIALKRWTARRAGEILAIDPRSFWQREWFDHWSRSDAEDDRIAAYIRKNPLSAGLVEKAQDYPWASARRGGG